MCVYLHVYMPAGTGRGQKEAAEPPGLELLAVVRLRTGVLGTKLQFSARVIVLLASELSL